MIQFKLICILIEILACLFVSAGVAGSPIIRCKYSVRDVAFVNVHGKSWQLQLIKPEDVDPREFAQWNESLRAKLARSNVGYAWIEPESDRAKRLRDVGSPKSALPLMALVDSHEAAIPITCKPGITFDQQLDLILSSPARVRVLNQVVDSLCVFIFVESGNEQLDGPARETLLTAIDQLNKQMWTLEKPTDKGPTLVTISSDQVPDDIWLLRSLGIEHSKTPAVAIVYGQGRRLGEVFVGQDIELKKLIGRASVCGQDCECDLNRDWLYGTQMIHVWSKSHERAAESSLSFDPHSAFVVAEVAQIMQKNSGRNRAPTDQSRVDLGGGLIIHDLDQNTSSEPENSETIVELQDPAASAATTEKKLLGEESSKKEGDEASEVSIPWPLIVGLAAVTIILLVFKLFKS